MKVAVIADDLSGAAELAGAAADSGWTAEVQTCFDPAGEAEVIALDTDTRALPAAAAAAVVAEAAADVLGGGARWVYKKTDSVLRGNVRAEVESVLRATGLRRALLVPANPSKGRVIRGGTYYVNGTPLAQTAFAVDPDHPRRSSAVRELLGDAGGLPLACGRDAEQHAPGGVVVPDVADRADLERLASRLDGNTLAAGGAEFFELRLGRGSAVPRPSRLRRPALFVCGSRQAWGQGRLTDCERRGIPALVMPPSLCASSTPCGDAIGEWTKQIRDALEVVGCAMAAIGDPADGTAVGPAKLTATLADAVANVLREGTVSTICIEGGATAAALLRAMGWTRLTALPSPGLPGVSTLRPVSGDAPTIVVKPGSYVWPDRLWDALTGEGVS
jgi:uncharacterized protein YgbK (DUF1537 family)